MNARRRSVIRPVWPLAACAVVALLWPISEVWAGFAYVSPIGHRLSVEVGPDWVALSVGRDNGTRSRHYTGRDLYIGRVTASNRSTLAFTRVYAKPGDYRFYSPLWVTTLLAGLFAAALIASRVRRDRYEQPGRCRQCGYDLRASPDRCPECGATVASV